MEIKLVLRAVLVGPEHLKHQVPDSLRLGTLKNQMIVVETQIGQILRSPGAGEAHPHVGPGVCAAGLVEGEHVGLDDEALPRCNMKGFVVHVIFSLAVQDIVDHLVGPHAVSGGVERFTFGITAETQIEVLNLAAGKLKYKRLFHNSFTCGYGLLISRNSLVEGCLTVERSMVSLWLR